MKTPSSDARRLLLDRGGNFAVATALMAPILIGLVGGSVDLYVFSHHRAELQATAEAAVLGAASEAGLKGWSSETAKQIVASVVEGNSTNRFGVTIAYTVEVDEKSRRIDLELTQDHYGYFFLGYFTSSPQIGVRASARATGQATICLISQSPSESEALSISGKSKIQASGCSAYSNSTSPKGIAVKDDSRLTTQLACSAGGYIGKGTSYSPVPITDCPNLSDPLASRASKINEGVIGMACSFKKTEIKTAGSFTLQPGTYCEGLIVSGAAKVTLEPGIYVIKDGPFRIDKSASLSAEGVGFVFVGDKAKLEFKNESAVSLSAPKVGLMSGLLMYAQATGKKPRDFKIESKNAQRLIGTVYLPSDILIVGGDQDGDGVCDAELLDDGTVVPAGPECLSDVGTASAWTAVVARKIKVTAGSSLVLNSDYSGSDIPVPDGIGPNSNKIRLVE